MNLIPLPLMTCPRRAVIPFCLALMGFIPTSTRAATQSQVITLQPGWNAVWIDPSPVYQAGTRTGEAMAVEDVWTDPRVTVVARPLLPAGSAEFVTDSLSVFNQEEWLVWYRNPQSLVNTLATMDGSQAYYVKLESGNTPLTVTITGRVGFFKPTWVPGSYNFLGFHLTEPVSFGEFLGPEGEATGNHPINSILRLDPSTGDWNGVQPTDLMEPGEAYWIKAVRNSSFSGPIAIAFDGLDTLAFGKGPENLTVGTPPIALISREITFTSVDDAPNPLSITLVTPNPADELKVYEVIPGPQALSHAIGPAGQITTWNPGDLPAQTTRTLTLGAQRNWSSGSMLRENLYRIDVGPQRFWLPVTAANEDVAPGAPTTPEAAYAGLWVGEVLLDSVSELEGSGLSPCTTTAPLQIILHADTNGAPSLLGHVMVMQTKTADASVPAQKVLVLDEAKIPYFEGIETRNGKRVGRRIETVAYDLPRNNDPRTQSALLDDVAAALGISSTNSVTAQDIETYLDSQDHHPPDLVEAYHLSWPLEGGLGPNAVARTATNAPLTLDPFHRSNPFRHAYHPQHGAGYPIARSLVITFDNTRIPDVLRGVYQESITGLAARPMTVRGSVTLHRISRIATTQ